MREIKFRAWDERNAEMVYSDKEDAFYINPKGAMFMYALPKPEPGLDVKYFIDYKLMQYTGLKDKNGKEIYEGDILNAYHNEFEVYEIAAVKYSAPAFTLGRYWKDGSHDWYSMEQYDSYELEVLGNIYENPELLEAEK